MPSHFEVAGKWAYRIHAQKNNIFVIEHLVLDGAKLNLFYSITQLLKAVCGDKYNPTTPAF